MKYFTINELTASATAKRLGIPNIPSWREAENLRLLVDNVLDPLREAWGAPVIVTSGYRSKLLNEMVGGAILVVIAFAIVWIGEPEYRNRRWNAAVSDGYAFYVDGQEVEPENIRHDQYSHITYDEKEHKVFLH